MSARQVASTPPTPHEPATTSTARSAAVSPSPLAGLLPSGQGHGLERLGDDRPARHRGSSGPPGGHLRRAVVDRQVDVDATMHPEGVDAEVGDEVDGRDGETAAGSQPAEAEGGQRIGGHDHAGSRLTHPTQHPPSGQQP